MQTRWTDPQEIGSNQSTIFQENRSKRFRFRSRTGSNYGKSFCIQCSVDSKDSPPSCSFSRLKELGLIHIGNAKWNRKFPEFPNLQKRGQPLERWTEIFETNFRKRSVPFDFETEFSEILVEWNAPYVTKKKKKNEVFLFSYLFSLPQAFFYL